jgi:N-acetylmuramoyl-L-alanine amidase
MKISNHKLVAEGNEKIFHNRKSPNFKDYQTADGKPKDLIIHYTAAGLSSTLNTFETNGGTSAHLVIDRNGDIYQMVPFNKQAFHAGYSAWDGLVAFNNRAIGIELINFGFDIAKANGASDIVSIKHKHKFIPQSQWQIYPKAQMDSLKTVTKLFLETYNLQKILGHDDISAGRKQDPGPAFNWDEYRTALFGSPNNIGKIFKTNTDGVNLRKSDSANSESLKKLKLGYEVGLIETWNNWSRVYLCNDASEVVFKGSNGKQQNKKIMGWIRSDLLTLK